MADKIIISDEFLLNFSRQYNLLKEEGHFPVQIRDMIMKNIGCTRYTFYKYLKISREKSFITDSYVENMAVATEIKREWLNDNKGNIENKKFVFPSLTPLFPIDLDPKINDNFIIPNAHTEIKGDPKFPPMGAILPMLDENVNIFTSIKNLGKKIFKR